MWLIEVLLRPGYVSNTKWCKTKNISLWGGLVADWRGMCKILLLTYKMACAPTPLSKLPMGHKYIWCTYKHKEFRLIHNYYTQCMFPRINVIFLSISPHKNGSMAFFLYSIFIEFFRSVSYFLCFQDNAGTLIYGIFVNCWKASFQRFSHRCEDVKIAPRWLLKAPYNTWQYN